LHDSARIAWPPAIPLKDFEPWGAGVPNTVIVISSLPLLT